MSKIVPLIIIVCLPFFGFTQGAFPKWDIDYAWGGDQDDYLMDIFQEERIIQLFLRAIHLVQIIKMFHQETMGTPIIGL